jgi:hypothetical protein
MRGEQRRTPLRYGAFILGLMPLFLGGLADPTLAQPGDTPKSRDQAQLPQRSVTRLALEARGNFFSVKACNTPWEVVL